MCRVLRPASAGSTSRVTVPVSTVWVSDTGPVAVARTVREGVVLTSTAVMPSTATMARASTATVRRSCCHERARSGSPSRLASLRPASSGGSSSASSAPATDGRDDAETVERGEHEDAHGGGELGEHAAGRRPSPTDPAGSPSSIQVMANPPARRASTLTAAAVEKRPTIRAVGRDRVGRTAGEHDRQADQPAEPDGGGPDVDEVGSDGQPAVGGFGVVAPERAAIRRPPDRLRWRAPARRSGRSSRSRGSAPRVRGA